MSATETKHEIKYERSKMTGNWCAKCICGWDTVGSRKPVMMAADMHMAGEPVWVAADPRAPEFAAE